MKQVTQDKYREHTKLRYSDRYSGNPLTDEDYYSLCEMCKNNDGINVSDGDDRKNCTKIMVKLNGKYVVCIFDCKNNIVKTVIPMMRKFQRMIF